ncbi:MAG: SIMPL domain-containing protein [Alphaproteobacteria bacterium]|nr:SIMPL domain-containing protein [Alphaproteobacteria bacterium]
MVFDLPVHVHEMTRRLFNGAALVAALGLCIAVTGIPGAVAEDGTGHHKRGQRTPHVQVQGVGTSQAVPDIAMIGAGVVTVSKSAGDAMARNNTRMVAVLAAAKAAGIATNDVQTSALRLTPRTDTRQGGQDRMPNVVGYRAENRARITARDLPGLGRLLDALVAVGANVLNGPHFGLTDPNAARDAARRLAFADARRRASLYAAEAGRTLGPVIMVTEDGGGPGRPQGRVMMLGAESAPIAPGELEFTARVMVRFKLLP